MHPVYVIRMDLIDALGLARPDPEWDHTAFAKLCAQLTKPTSSGRRFGANFPWWTDGIREGTFLLNGFGTGLTDPSGTTSQLGSSAAIRAGNWVYQELFWPGYAAAWDQNWTLSFMKGLAQGLSVMQFSWGGSSSASALGGPIGYAEVLGQGPWAFYPFPYFPAGRATMGSNTFYAIPETSAHPDEAWRLLEWIGTSPVFQREEMRAWGGMPSLVQLLPEWEAYVVDVAAFLKGRGLQWWTDPVLKDYAYPMDFYRYGDQQVRSAIKPEFTDLFNQHLSVTEGFTQAANVVDAMEKTFSATAARVQAVEAVPVTPTSNYPAPAVAGTAADGPPATAATPWVIADSTTGSYTLLGDGATWGGLHDNGVFASSSATATEGEWVCRLFSITNVNCPHLSQWSKFGLVARSTLSAESAMFGVCVMGPHGVTTLNRDAAGSAASVDFPLAFTLPGSTTGAKGTPPLINAQAAQGQNALIKPVWLKLARHGTTWTASASWDGQNWTVVKERLTDLGGVWVGVAACADNISFNSVGYARAVFDHLTFRPARMDQIGTVGVPPAAGSVPATWAG